MATFTALNRDVLFLVCLIVHDISRPTLFSLIRVNRLFHEVVLPLVYRQCTFDFTVALGDGEPFQSTHRRINTILSSDENIIFRSTRTLIIRTTNFKFTWISSYDGNLEHKWGSLANLIPRFTNLCKVIFDCCDPMPLFLLRALEMHHPSSCLHIINWSRPARDTKAGEPGEEALAKTPLLRTITAKIGFAPGSDFYRAALQRIAALSPNLETLELALPDSHMKLPAIPFPPPPSKELLRFQVQNPVKKTLKRLQWDYMELNQLKALASWLHLPGLTSLHVYMFDSSKTLAYAIENHIFDGLKRVAMALPRAVVNEDGDIMSHFVASLNCLEAISLDSCPNLRPLLDAISFHHGHSLRLLRVHNAEMSRGTRPTLSFDQLKTYRTQLEHIEALSIDINRSESGQRELEIYSVLSTFPHLQILTIQYDLGVMHVPGYGADFYDVVDEMFARYVWMFVAQPRLQELRLILGEPGRGRQNQIFFESDAWVEQEKKVIQQIVVHQVEGALRIVKEGARSSEMCRAGSERKKMYENFLSIRRETLGFIMEDDDL
ncbi:hypothetical protein DL96DRAFT_1677975 [Flagelloscypha sp. PMI_526]|nr:hypothetical protein DL96DRAFT_1677975 [Flagelloscypha sp. PMI_526]